VAGGVDEGDWVVGECERLAETPEGSEVEDERPAEVERSVEDDKTRRMTDVVGVLSDDIV